MTHLSEEQLVLHYYGEEGDTLAAEQHLEACGDWLQVLQSGRVKPSPAFQAWAEAPEQHGFHLAPRTPANRTE